MSDFIFAPLVPELSCSDLAVSLNFYVDLIGFNVAYDRPEDKFAFLNLGGAQIMLEQANGAWDTAELVQPFGRGINFMIEVPDISSIAARLTARNVTLFQEITKSSYRTASGQQEQLEFLVLDPDGYLLRFCEFLSD